MSDSANDFNSAKWVADFASQFLQKNLEKIYGGGKRLLKGAAENISLLLASYEDYLNCVVDRYSKTRSFLIRDESIDLHQFYVPLGVSCGDKKIPQASIRTLITKNNFVVITGSGGSGKSMMMRYLFLDAVKSKEKVPIFVELRDINDSDKSILELIKHALTANKFGFGDEYIEKALKAGLFAILLDGYDEVTNAKRKQVADEIEQLTQDYDKNYIIVSSRPDLEFGGWQPFKVCEISPLTLKQACELVEKVPGDEELKAKFTKDLQEKLFEEHNSFLSNPLLLSIMLLTYKVNAEIPKKLSIFYQQAYEALFNRHDALKGTWQREHATNLDIDDFARIFSAFSLLTYDKRVISFAPMDAIAFLKVAKRLKSIDFDSEDYLNDAKKAVCLLIDDGRDLSFAHRSFQEYFTAKFIAEAAPDKQELLIEKYASNIRRDKVLHLLHDINPELVERVYIIPGIQAIENTIGFKGKLNLEHYSRFLSIATSSIGLLTKPSKRGKLSYFFSLVEPKLISNTSVSGTENMPNISDFYSFLIRRYVNDKNPFDDPTDKDIASIEELKLLLEKKTTGELDKIGSDGMVDIRIENIICDFKVLEIFSRGHHFLSMNTLSTLINIKNELIKKHQKVDASLDEILGV